MQERGGAPRRLLAILSYHKVGEPPRGAWEPWNYVPEGMLEAQLTALHDDGWRFVTLADALQGLSEPEHLPARSALVTFDDAYRSLPERGLPVLRALGCPGVVFAPVALIGSVSSFDSGIAEPVEPLCSWDELHALEAAGVSVQSHGLRHVHLSTVSAEALETELAQSKEELERELEKPVEMFAFPYGDGGADPAAVARVLKRCGYRAACLYGGGPVTLPAADPYRLERLAVGFDTDVAAELAAFAASGTAGRS